MNTKHCAKIILSLMVCCMLLNACELYTRKVLYNYEDSNGTTPVKKYEVVQEREYDSQGIGRIPKILRTTEIIQVAGQIQKEDNSPAATEVKLFDKSISVSSDGTFSGEIKREWIWNRDNWVNDYKAYEDYLFVISDSSGTVREYPGNPFVTLNFGEKGDSVIRYDYPFVNGSSFSKKAKSDKNVITISK